MAYMGMADWEKAAVAFYHGLELDPCNKAMVCTDMQSKRCHHCVGRLSNVCCSGKLLFVSCS